MSIQQKRKLKSKPLREIGTGETCSYIGCDREVTHKQGPGADFCFQHQMSLRENGGPGNRNRPHSMNKYRPGTVVDACEHCGYDPCEDPRLLRIEPVEVREEVMRRAMDVDHKQRKVDSGDEHPDNYQTLCKPCHLEKTICEERGIPWPSTPD